MSFVISSFITFPNIAWWALAGDTNLIYFDKAEHFEKMTCHNRYYVSGANGLIQLTVPLAHGRNQRAAMKEIEISNREQWQLRHWRTLTSVYKRSPYFDFYEGSLKKLYEAPFTLLVDFNIASVHWLKEQLDIRFEETYTDDHVKDYPAGDIDLRKINRKLKQENRRGFPEYYQLFRERTGFLPNLSMLDLLFVEGPHAGTWLQEHNLAIRQFVNSAI